MPSIARKACLREENVGEQKERERLLILARVEDLLEAIRDAHRDQESYLPAVRAVEKVSNSHHPSNEASRAAQAKDPLQDTRDCYGKPRLCGLCGTDKLWTRVHSRQVR